VPAVLDASALLAYLQAEPGGDVAEAAILGGAVIGYVNLAETLTKLVQARSELASQLDAAANRNADPRSLPGLPGSITVEPFTPADVARCAALELTTRPLGLGLGDRACLAVGRRLGGPVLTTDRVWTQLDPAVIGVEVRCIRPPAATPGPQPKSAPPGRP